MVANLVVPCGLVFLRSDNNPDSFENLEKLSIQKSKKGDDSTFGLSGGLALIVAYIRIETQAILKLQFASNSQLLLSEVGWWYN